MTFRRICLFFTTFPHRVLKCIAFTERIWATRWKGRDNFVFQCDSPGENYSILVLYSLNFKDGLNSFPSLTYGDGDGTVNMRSLVGCTYWQNTTPQHNATVYHQAFPNVEHYNLLGDNRVINYIIGRLIPNAVGGPVKWTRKSQSNARFIRLF